MKQVTQLTRTFVFSLTAISSSLILAQDIAPKTNIKSALQIAETYVKQNKIVTANMHINSAVYNAIDNPPHWSITWKSNKLVKGGWFVVHIYPDKSCQVEYGE